MSEKITKLLCLVALFAIMSNTYTFDNSRGKIADITSQAPTDSLFSVFYNELISDVPKPGYDVFEKALTGFFSLKADNTLRKDILTIIDFSLSSNRERLWIVDLAAMKVLHFSLVAHGRNSGDEYAMHFSNTLSSYQSSLGFYMTDGIYSGRHGMSLYLDGLEPRFNDQARRRTIVMHSADYVSQEFISQYGRLGRSLGCPSIPLENHEEILNILAGGSCVYIHHPDEKYQSGSVMFNPENAFAGLTRFLSENPGLPLPVAESQTFADYN